MHAVLGVLLWILLATHCSSQDPAVAHLAWALSTQTIALPKHHPSKTPYTKVPWCSTQNPTSRPLPRNSIPAPSTKGPTSGTSTLACTRVLHGQPRATRLPAYSPSLTTDTCTMVRNICHNTYPYTGAPLRWSAFERLEKTKILVLLDSHPTSFTANNFLFTDTTAELPTVTTASLKM